MKFILAIIAFTVINHIHAQEKELVYSIVKVIHEPSWYETQARLWKEDIDADSQNEEAWYNYYTATRGLANVTQDPDARKAIKEQCLEISKAAYKAIPNTFVGNLVYYHGGLGNVSKDYLLKAYEINPNDWRNFDDMLVHFETMLDAENATVMAKKMFEANQLSSNLLNWGYNVLSELDEDAIVFTRGDNDTYALWIVQRALGVRSDVTIINTSLIRLDDYRKLVTDKLNLEEFKLEKSDNSKALLSHFLDNSEGIPAYVSMSGIGEFTQLEIDENLYLNGLTYKFSKEQFDNTAVIRRNYEKRYLTDYLKYCFNHEEMYRHVEGHLDAMYLASMVKLYNAYLASEETGKATELKVLIDQIAKRTGKTEDVQGLLKGE